MDPAAATTRLQQGLDLVMLGHTRRKLAANQRHLNQYREGMLRREGLPPAAKEDEMLVLGDVSLNTTQTAAPVASAANHGLRSLALAAIAGAGLGLPIAAALALPTIRDWLRPQPVTEAPVEFEPILLPGRPESAEGR